MDYQDPVEDSNLKNKNQVSKSEIKSKSMSSEEGQINSSKINKMALRHEQQQIEHLKEQKSIISALSTHLQKDEKGLLVKPPLQKEEEESESSYYYDEEDESEKSYIKNQKQEQPIAQKSISKIQIQIPVEKPTPLLQIQVQQLDPAIKQQEQVEESEEESYYDEEEESEDKEFIPKKTVELLADELDIAGICMNERGQDVKPNLIAQFQQEHLDGIDDWRQVKGSEKTSVKILLGQNDGKGSNIKSNPFFDIKDSDPESGELSPQFKKKSNLNSKFQVSNEINQLSHSFGVKKEDLQNDVKFNLKASKNSDESKSSNLDSSFKSLSKEKTQEKQIKILNQSQTSSVKKKGENNEQGDELNITITEVEKGIQNEMAKNEESGEEDQLNQEVYNKASGLVNNALVTFQSAFPYDKDNRIKILKRILKAKTQKQLLDEKINDTIPEENSRELLKAITVKQTTFRESLESKSSKNSSKLAQFSKYVKEQNQKNVKKQQEFEKFKERISQEKAELFIDRPMVNARFLINEILKNRSSPASGSDEPENENKTLGVKVTDHFLQMEETPRSLKEKLIMSLNGSKLSLNGSKSSLKVELDPEKNRTLVEQQLKERYFDEYDHSKINDASNSISISENIGQHRLYKQINSNISQNISNASISQKQNNSQASDKFEQFRKQIEADLLRISKNSKKTSCTEVRDKTNTAHDKKSSHSLSAKSCRVSQKSNQSEIIQSMSDKKIIQNNSFDAQEKMVTVQQLKEEPSFQKEEPVLNQTINKEEEDVLGNEEAKDKVSEEEQDLLFGQLEHHDINLNNQQINDIQNDYQEQTQETIQNQSGSQVQDQQQPMMQTSFSSQNKYSEEEIEYEQEEDNLKEELPEQFSFQNEEIYRNNFTQNIINQFTIMEETPTTQEVLVNQSQNFEETVSFQPQQQFYDEENLGIGDPDQDDGDYRDQQRFDQLQAEQQQISDDKQSDDELNQDFEYDQEMQEEIEIQENIQIDQNITQYSENYEHPDEKDDYQNDEYDNLIQQQDQESLIQDQQKQTMNTQEDQIESQPMDNQQIQNYEQNDQQSIYGQDLTYQLSEFNEQQQEKLVNNWQVRQSQNFQSEQYKPEMADSPKKNSNTYTEVPSSTSSPRQQVNFHLQLENEKKDGQDEQIIIDQPYREMVQKQIRTQKQFLRKTPIVLPRPQTSQASRSKLKGQKLLSRNASANSYSSLKRNNIMQSTLNSDFNHCQNTYQMIRTNQTIGMPLRRTFTNSSLEKEEEIFYDKIARLSIPVRQQIRANSSSTESRIKKLKSLERLKSGLQISKKNLNKQTSEYEQNKQVQEALKIGRIQSGVKTIQGRNKKNVQTEEIKSCKIKISRPQTSLNRIPARKVLAISESHPIMKHSSPSRSYFDYKTMSDTISNEERAKRIMTDIETLYQIQNAGATFKVQRNNKRDLLALKSGYHQINVQKYGAQILYSNNQTMNILQGKAEYLPEESLNNFVEVTWRDVQNPKTSSLKEVSKDQSSQGMQGLQQAQIKNRLMNKSSLARIKPHIFESERNPNSILVHQSSEQFLKRYQGGLLKQFKLEVNNKSHANLPKFMIKGQTPIKREIIQSEDGDKEPSFCNLVLSRTKLYSRLDPRIVQSPFLQKLR